MSCAAFVFTHSLISKQTQKSECVVLCSLLSMLKTKGQARALTLLCYDAMLGVLAKFPKTQFQKRTFSENEKSKFQNSIFYFQSSFLEFSRTYQCCYQLPLAAVTRRTSGQVRRYVQGRSLLLESITTTYHYHVDALTSTLTLSYYFLGSTHI